MLKILSSLTLLLLFSGCSYKMELVSKEDNSVYFGIISELNTFNIAIRDEYFKGSWDETVIRSNGTTLRGQNFSTSTIKGGKIWERGSNGSLLICDFSLGNSIEYGTCTKDKEEFDLKIE